MTSRMIRSTNKNKQRKSPRKFIEFSRFSFDSLRSDSFISSRDVSIANSPSNFTEWVFQCATGIKSLFFCLLFVWVDSPKVSDLLLENSLSNLFIARHIFSPSLNILLYFSFFLFVWKFHDGMHNGLKVSFVVSYILWSMRSHTRCQTSSTI